MWAATVPGQRCVRVREGGEVLGTVAVDLGCFACMLGGEDGRTLFIAAAQWHGMQAAMSDGPDWTGRLLAAPDQPAPHARLSLEPDSAAPGCHGWPGPSRIYSPASDQSPQAPAAQPATRPLLFEMLDSACAEMLTPHPSRCIIDEQS